MHGMLATLMQAAYHEVLLSLQAHHVACHASLVANKFEMNLYRWFAHAGRMMGVDVQNPCSQPLSLRSC